MVKPGSISTLENILYSSIYGTGCFVEGRERGIKESEDDKFPFVVGSSASARMESFPSRLQLFCLNLIFIP